MKPIRRTLGPVAAGLTALVIAGFPGTAAIADTSDPAEIVWGEPPQNMEVTPALSAVSVTPDADGFRLRFDYGQSEIPGMPGVHAWGQVALGVYPGTPEEFPFGSDIVAEHEYGMIDDPFLLEFPDDPWNGQTGTVDRHIQVDRSTPVTVMLFTAQACDCAFNPIFTAGAALPALEPGQPGAPALEASPAGVYPGETVTVHGTGFPDGDWVVSVETAAEVFEPLPPHRAGEPVELDAGGGFEVRFLVPAGAAPGTYPDAVRAVSGTGEQLTTGLEILAPVTVRPAAPVQDGNVVTVPRIEGVEYRESGGGVLLPGDITLQRDLRVVAVPGRGFVFESGSETEWFFSYRPGGEGTGDPGSGGGADDPGAGAGDDSDATGAATGGARPGGGTLPVTGAGTPSTTGVALGGALILAGLALVMLSSRRRPGRMF